MIDRLRELGGPASHVQDISTAEEAEELKEAIDKNLRIQCKLEKLSVAIDMLQPYRKRLKETISSEEQNKIQNEIEKSYQLIKSDLFGLNKELRDLQAEIDTNQDIEESDREKMLTNVKLFYKMYEENLQKTQTVYFDLKKIVKEQLIRKVRMVDDKLNPQEIDDLIEENPQAFEELMMRKTVGAVSRDLKNAADDIVQKCESIKRLQKNVKELIEMLKTISQIVNMQGERVDSIADHITQTKDYMADANKHLVKAKKHHSSYRCVT